MAEARQRDQWNHTAQLLALMYNAWRGRGQRALQPADFHPFVKRALPTIDVKTLVKLGGLKQKDG